MLTRRSIALSPPQDSSRASHRGENLVGEKTPPSSREGEGTKVSSYQESENAHSGGERAPLDPWGHLYIGGEGAAIYPRPLGGYNIYNIGPWAATFGPF